MARINIVTSEGIQTVELKAHNTVGRHPNNSVQLLDKIVSKEHCIILQADGRWILRDLGSLNGTYINGDRVQGERQLMHGDEISLGSTKVRFDDGSGLAIRTPPPAPTPMQPPAHPFGFHAGGSPTGAHQLGGPLPQPTASAATPSALRRVPTGDPVEPTAQIPMRGAPVAPAPMPPSVQQPATTPGSFVEMQQRPYAIGTQIAAMGLGFAPFDKIAHDAQTVRDDYERLRIAYEVTQEIATEREVDIVLQKILIACFKFVRADRGVVFLEEKGELIPRCNRRRGGDSAPVSVSKTILEHVQKTKSAVLTNDAAMDFGGARGKSVILNRISSAMVVPLIHGQELLGVIWLDSEQLTVFTQKELEVVAALAYQAAMFVENALLAKKVEAEIITRDRFSRLLAPVLAQQIISGQLEVKLGGSLSECTVFNSDIRGFTKMSDGASPQTIVAMLNEYFERMVECLFREEGTLDKFMGDGIMAVFGAPVSHPDDPIRAVRSALDMMDSLGVLNRERLARNELPLAIGIGIHTGKVIAGYVGSSRALSYTVIGDTANTSARLCGIAEAGQILVSEATAERLQNKFNLQELPPAKLKGIARPMRLFNVQSEVGIARPVNVLAPSA